MTLATAVYSAAVVFVASLVRGIAGFSSGLIAVPLLTLVTPVTAVVPVVVSLDYVSSASQSARNLHDIAWREQAVLLPSWASSPARPCCTSRRRCPSPPRASLPEGGSRRALSQRTFVQIVGMLLLGGGIALLLRY